MYIWSILRSFGLFYGHLVYFTVIWYILRLFGIFHSQLVYFVLIWVFSRFGMLYLEKSGTPAPDCVTRFATKGNYPLIISGTVFDKADQLIATRCQSADRDVASGRC
jgi:hypothetical protein